MDKAYKYIEPTGLRRAIGFLLAGPLNPLIILIAINRPRSILNASGEATPLDDFGLAIMLSVCAAIAMAYVVMATREQPISPRTLRIKFAIGSLIPVGIVSLFFALFDLPGCGGLSCVTDAAGLFLLSFAVGTLIAAVIGFVAYFVLRIISLEVVESAQ